MTYGDNLESRARIRAARTRYWGKDLGEDMGDTERKQGRPYKVPEFAQPISKELRDDLEQAFGPGSEVPGIGLVFLPDVRMADPILELEDDGQVMEPIPPKAKE